MENAWKGLRGGQETQGGGGRSSVGTGRKSPVRRSGCGCGGGDGWK